MKKSLLLCLVVLLLLPFALMANGAKEEGATVSVEVNPAGTFPIVNEKVELTVLTAQDPLVVDFDENSQTKWIEEQTNVHINWQLVPSQQADEKINLILAAGSDLPDVFLQPMAPDLQMKYGEEGVFIDLKPYIAEYGDEINNAIADFSKSGVDFLGMYTAPDGKIYALPSLNVCKWCETIFRCWVRNDWLDTLGLDMPDTVDEFYDMLVAMKTQDPNGNGIADEIPLMGSYQGWGTQVEGFLMFPYIVYDAGNSDKRLINDKGMIKAAYMQDEWLEGLTFINKLINEGLLDPVSLTQQKQELQVMGEKEIPEVGTFLESNFNHLTLKDDKYKDFEAIEPLQGVHTGVKQTFANAFQPFENGRFAITEDCENPAVAYRWADFLYTPENSIWQRYGEKGIDWLDATADQKGPFGAPAVFQEVGQWGEPTERSLRQKMMYLSFDVYSGLAMADNSDAYYVMRTPKYMDNGVYNGLPNVFMQSMEVDEFSELKTTLDTYVDESFARFVTGDLPLSEFDSFRDECKKIGIDRYLELYQAAFDRQFK